MLVRRKRVSARTRPADQKAKATESVGATSSSARGRGASAPSAESAGAAGSGPLRADPAAGAHAPDQREEGHRDTVRFAVGADCCGALSCRETEPLLEVERNGEKRVLCPDCAAGWSP